MRFNATHSFRLLTTTLAAGSLVLAGCGGGDSDDGTDTPANEPAPSNSHTVGDADTWPLTGLPVEGGSSEQKHPVLVLKMDNTYSSAPQKGLSHADMVVEELVEGGLTRLAAFFYSDIPGVVGPVGVSSRVGGAAPKMSTSACWRVSRITTLSPNTTIASM